MITILALLKIVCPYNDQLLNNSASSPPTTLPHFTSFSQKLLRCFFLLFRSTVFSSGCPTPNSEFGGQGAKPKPNLFKTERAHLELKT